MNELTTSSKDYLARNNLIIEWFNELEDNNLWKFPVFDLFCSKGETGRCYAQRNGVPLYDDDDHLSYAGSKMVVDPIVERLVQSQP